MLSDTCPDVAGWTPTASGDCAVHASLESAMSHLDCPLYVLNDKGTLKYAVGGALCPHGTGIPVIAFAPPCPPAHLGDRGFLDAHGLTYPCYAGSMAHGIASEVMVSAMGASGMLGFFGSAGLSLDALRATVQTLSKRMDSKPFGFNLINSPGNLEWEQGAVSLFLAHGIHLVEASAYITPTRALVKYRLKGAYLGTGDAVITPNNIIAKVSRSEVATRFLEPPPGKLVGKLLAAGEITAEEAQLAARLPMAQDITAEADSGGHTDHRSAMTLLPTLLQLRNAVQRKYHYQQPPRVGLAGGMGAPESAAAAFAMGAAYIVTGSINQACVESGTSFIVREMLAQASQTDVADAPAADMFEMGATVQVLKRGTRFAERASKLYDLYRRYDSIEALPPDERTKIETVIFRASLDDIWKETRAFFAERNPQQLEKAEDDPRKKMALTFRWYLGNAAHWANAGQKDRKQDFQIWCGPAMGAFNDWTRESFLEEPKNREVAVVALQLLHGAALRLRIQTLRAQGIMPPLNHSWKAPHPEIT